MRSVVLSFVATVALARVATTRANPNAIDEIIALLPPQLASVVRPMPPMPDASMRSKLAWMAELAHRVDERERLSATTAWRAVMGWAEASDEGGLLPPSPAADLGLERYPVPLGRTDPAIDFAASVALAWLDVRHFSCDFPLRARFLRDNGLAPAGPLPIEAGRCKAFEAWARPDEVTAIDLVYVAQRWQDAAATMGHVLFRVRRTSTGVVGPSFETVFSYIAKDSADTPGYMLKGMTGGLTAGVKLDAFGDIWARYGVREGRDLHVFELRLSADERRFLLAEVFAQDRRGMKVPYAFFTTNCATLAWDTLRAVLPELPEHDGLLVHPHEVASMMLRADRATARGVIPAVRTLARRAEQKREALAALDEVARELPELLAAHARRWEDVETRAQALRALKQALVDRTVSDGTKVQLAAWTDAVLDIEAFAVDQAQHGYVPGTTSPALEAALDLRASLPAGEVFEEDDPVIDPTLLTPFASAPVGPSGSRRSAILAGVSDLGDSAGGARATLAWQTSVLDEAVGEPRQVVLAGHARMRLLVNELTLSSGLGGDVAIESERLVIVDSASYANGVHTDQSWFGSHLGFAFGLETRTHPREGLPFALLATVGPTLTLAASDDWSSHIVIEASVRLASWARVDDGDPAFRSTLGFALALAAPLGDANRVHLYTRIAPGYDLGGFALEHELTLGLDFALGHGGLFLVLAASHRGGLPVGDGPEAHLGIAY